MKRQLKHHPYLNISQDSIKVPQDKYKSDPTVETSFFGNVYSTKQKFLHRNESKSWTTLILPKCNEFKIFNLHFIWKCKYYFVWQDWLITFQIALVILLYVQQVDIFSIIWLSYPRFNTSKERSLIKTINWHYDLKNNHNSRLHKSN